MVYILPRYIGCNDCAGYQEIHSLYWASVLVLFSLAEEIVPLCPPFPCLAFSDSYFSPWRAPCLCQVEPEIFGEGNIFVAEVETSLEADN